MELAYKKLMDEHGLKLSDLPEEAVIAIKSVQQVAHGIEQNEKRGKRVNDDTFRKLKSLDKHAMREIMDYVEELENKNPKPAAKTDPDPQPNNDPPATEEPKPEPKVEMKPEADPKGVKIDSELEPLYKAGKTSLTLAEIKDSAKTAYNILFDAYEEGKENGIETSHYRLVESEKEVFTLSKI
jgi:hypothetical protein